MVLFKSVLGVILIQMVFTMDTSTIEFIKSFIINERKPTMLVLGNLCSGKEVEVELAKEMFRRGTRISKFKEIGINYQNHFLMYLVDLDCSGSDQIIETASQRNLFSSPYRWLMFSNSTRPSQLEDSPILHDSDVVLAKRTSYGFELVELHRTSPNGTMILTPRGFFNGSFFDSRPNRELFRRRQNMMGHPLTMSNVIQDSNSTQYHLPREDALELHNDIIPKISWMIAKLAFEMVNATPRYIFSYRWGYKVNGQWSGMVHDLETNKADLGTDCVLLQSRLEVVTYTDTIAPFRVRFIFRQPPLASVANIFSLSFSQNVWIALVVCTLTATAAVCLALKWEASLVKDSQRVTGNVEDAILLTMCAVSQQGCVIEPKRVPGRIIVLVLFTALMALYAAYSANIVVLLQAPSNSITTLAELAASKITLAANDVDYTRFIFSVHKNPLHVAIGKRIKPEKGKGEFYSMEEGVEKIRQGLFAFHSMVEVVYRRIEQTFLEAEKCDLTEVNFYSSFAPFVPMKKDSPYIELIKVAFKQIREVGLRAALNKRYQVPKPACASKISAFSTVGLSDMWPVVVLMLYGVALSLAVLAAELIVYRM